ncbi:MAG: hypothetical protein JKY48_13450, partial [Flavobacteriales bacterium]|nr:hypothetical protein [Flavobacteriales bacterium]
MINSAYRPHTLLTGENGYYNLSVFIPLPSGYFEVIEKLQYFSPSSSDRVLRFLIKPTSSSNPKGVQSFFQ